MARDPSTAAGDDPRNKLTPVYAVLKEPQIEAMIAEFSRPVVLDAIKAFLAACRRELAPGDPQPSMEQIVAGVRAKILEVEGERLRPVINATGIILHTGLGRAVLPQRAVDALGKLNRCTNMQVDLQSGKRGRRNFVTEQLLCKLTGAEAAVLVNNNAAATMLILAALCAGREVIVSHGQLIEIGGSFRLPDCIRQSGAELVMVGTTNRTHLRDYEAALGENTGAILRANPSNYRVIGFNKEVSIAELCTLKKKRDVMVIDDLGCGALVDMSRFGLPKEPTVQESLAAGADLACFSGDKLIGGAQAGIIVGKQALVQKIRKHPFTRMMRVCKLTDLVLEQSLRLFLDEERLTEDHPTLRMLSAPLDALKARAERIAARVRAKGCGLELRVKEDESATGGGSMPAAPIPTWVLALRSSARSSAEIGYLLRQNEPPVIARISEGEVLLDMRTLLDEEEEEQVCQALEHLGEALA